ncbi:MAG: hypothetical protein M3Z24_07105, partial [Chloroflexota bacterium]|nr:hypothetical protein [Chloroflexota bacterium]
MTPSEQEQHYLRPQPASPLLSSRTHLDRQREDIQPHVRRRLQQKGVVGDDLDDLCAEAIE